MSLYAIDIELQAVLGAMLDGGADSPEAKEALEAHLAGLDAALDSKADSYAAMIRELESRAQVRKEEANRIRNLAAMDEALSTRLKTRLKEVMERTGRTKIETPRFYLSVAGNGGKNPLEITVDPATLPKDLQIVRIEADKEAIRTALEAGGTIEGCALLPRGTSLRIR
jgi:hypothetical protein